MAGARLWCAVTAASRQADVNPVHPGLAGAVDALPLYRVAHHLLLHNQPVTTIHTLASSSWRTQRTCTAPQTISVECSLATACLTTSSPCALQARSTVGGAAHHSAGALYHAERLLQRVAVAPLRVLRRVVPGPHLQDGTVQHSAC